MPGVGWWCVREGRRRDCAFGKREDGEDGEGRGRTAEVGRRARERGRTRVIKFETEEASVSKGTSDGWKLAMRGEKEEEGGRERGREGEKEGGRGRAREQARARESERERASEREKDVGGRKAKKTDDRQRPKSSRPSEPSKLMCTLQSSASPRPVPNPSPTSPLPPSPPPPPPPPTSPSAPADLRSEKPDRAAIST